jgi:DNA-directed RNA polymerase I, II, and III subunit RPABC1
MADSGTLTIGEMSKMYRVMQTTFELVSDRHYQPPSEWLCPSLDAFKRDFVHESVVLREKMMLIAHRDADEDHLFVFFNGEPSVNTQRIKEYALKARAENATRVLLVTAGRLNPAAKKYVEELPREPGAPLHMQVFDEDDLVVNITKHELVPKHDLMSADETREVLDTYSLKTSMLPRILSRDPVALYYGASKGEVFRITRKSETAGTYITYRQVL